MPHSSGGGSSGGGGFHSSSSSHGGSSYTAPRLSSRPFAGATCYVYYDRLARPRVFYGSKGTAPQKLSGYITTFLFLGIFLIVPIAVLLFMGIHNPSKISQSYSSTIVIQDDLNVISSSERESLQTVFQEFYDSSGATPAVLTVPNSAWNGRYASLEGYAYSAYLKLFDDESHWLIVYSSDDDGYTSWAFEGMQGDDTDPVITVKVADAFNATCYAELENSSTPAHAIEKGFQATLPILKSTYFYVEPGFWAFMAIWEGITLLAFGTTIYGFIAGRRMSKATVVNGPIHRAKCPKCGNEYIEGSVTVCPNCRCSLPPRYAHPDFDQTK